MAKGTTKKTAKRTVKASAPRGGILVSKKTINQFNKHLAAMNAFSKALVAG